MERNLDLVTRRAAISIVLMAYYRGEAHLASSLSVIDGLVAVLNFVDKGDSSSKHRIFLSKGHAAPALYAALAEFGIIEPNELLTFNTPMSRLGIHPSRTQLPEVEYSSGSLGHGLGIAAGVALGNRLRGDDSFAFAVLGDGETNEGSIWEGAMFSANQNLTNLVVLVDHNKVQSVARYEEVAGDNSIENKFKAFGWEAVTLPGNNVNLIFEELNRFSKDSQRIKPLAIILDSIAGARVSCMENQVLWHYRRPSDQEFQLAMRELDASIIAPDLLEIFL